MVTSHRTMADGSGALGLELAQVRGFEFLIHGHKAQNLILMEITSESMSRSSKIWMHQKSTLHMKNATKGNSKAWAILNPLSIISLQGIRTILCYTDRHRDRCLER